MNMADKINILMKCNNIKNPKELSEKLNQQNLKIPYKSIRRIYKKEKRKQIIGVQN